MISIGFNMNINLLMGGCFCGNEGWNKSASNIDNCFKLYHVTNGKAIVNDGQNNFELSAGNLYFINGYRLKSQKYIEPFFVEWLHFTPKSLYFSHTLKQSPLITKLSLDDFNSFTGYFENFASFFDNKLEDSEQRLVQVEIQSLLYFTFTKVLRTLTLKTSDEDERNKRIVPALEYIAENYRRPISLKDMAGTCCLSPNYFHRIFSEIFNTSPLNYIKELRMDEAIRQLVYTNSPVKTIAFNVGYDDEAYFSRVFSKNFGTSPGNYRKQLKRNVP